MVTTEIRRWTVHESEELYEIKGWGKGYFSIGENGNMRVHPTKSPDVFVDLKQLIDALQARGLDLPILVRFNDILRHRLQDIHDAFQNAIREHDYRGKYVCVYPIKVNQQRHVVEQILEHGKEFGFGLEAGSKPELLAVVAMAGAETPIVCNGFKDSEFIEIAMMAQKLGRKVIPVVEKFTELSLILDIAKQVGVRPQIGMRVKLAARGSGRWQSSGGYRSKFGLTVSEVLKGFELLKEQGMEDCFKLLHFHLGSQITNIRYVKTALIEAARIYADLVGRGAGLEMLDVGGGLGVDYDGSQTNFESSVNYTLQEYANDVVHHLQSVLDDVGVPHPTIVSESGRAIAAYHSALIYNVLGVSGYENGEQPYVPTEDDDQVLHDLYEAHNSVNTRNIIESFHDAQQAFDMAISAFATGHLPLDKRGAAESLFFSTCRKIKRLSQQLDFLPEELEGLDTFLSHTYFCNFSLFQSIPDSWAIKQLFPVVPIHRHGEEPTRRAILGDITCDSDGKIDLFIDRRDVRKTLPLHEITHEPYYMGIFLIGAYQEILGDLHNLFGDTHAVHVSVNDRGETMIDNIIRGDTVSEVLQYVQFNPAELLERLHNAVEVAVRSEQIDHRQAGKLLKFYEESLRGYTYLEDPQD